MSRSQPNEKGGPVWVRIVIGGGVLILAASSATADASRWQLLAVGVAVTAVLVVLITGLRILIARRSKSRPLRGTL